MEGYQQYPAVRCAQGENICMYSRTASQTVESMNQANMSIREQTAVDPINAIILFLRLELKRYSQNKEKAESWNEVLTSHGKKLQEKVFLW